MDTKEIFEKLCSVDSGLTPSTIRYYISTISSTDLDNFLPTIDSDGDKQYALDYHMRKALSSRSNNIKVDVRRKILSVLSFLDQLSQNVTQEESDKSAQSKRDYNDLDARLTAVKQIIESKTDAIDELTDKYTELESKYSAIDKDLIDAQSALAISKQELQNAAKQTESVISQSITILGIFVAIIAVFLGGFAGITLLDKISTFNTYKFYLSIVIVGHIMINLIFMFIYMLSRIIDKNVSVNCNNYVKGRTAVNNNSIKDTCQTCFLNNTASCRAYNKHYKTNYSACSLFKRLKYKYPYMYFINVIGCLAEALLCVGWLFDDIIMSIKITMTQHIQGTIFISMVALILIIGVIWRYNDK